MCMIKTRSWAYQIKNKNVLRFLTERGTPQFVKLVNYSNEL